MPTKEEKSTIDLTAGFTRAVLKKHNVEISNDSSNAFAEASVDDVQKALKKLSSFWRVAAIQPPKGQEFFTSEVKELAGGDKIDFQVKFNGTAAHPLAEPESFFSACSLDKNEGQGKEFGESVKALEDRAVGVLQGRDKEKALYHRENKMKFEGSLEI